MMSSTEACQITTPALPQKYFSFQAPPQPNNIDTIPAIAQ
jgi:hypothetical protein